MTVLDHVSAPCDTVDLSDNVGERVALSRVRTAQAALASECAAMLCDDVTNPTRGDIFFAARTSTTALTAFAIRHGSGFLQVALPSERCDELMLEAQRGDASLGVPQCVTVDAKAGIGTGISAADRAHTARLLGSSKATFKSFTRPGHVVPLRTQLARPVSQFRFWEGAAWIAGAAGMGCAAALTTVEGIHDPTTTAAGEEIRCFAEEHRLPLVGIRDLIPASPVNMIFHQDVSLFGQQSRLASFAEGDDEYLCLLVGGMAGSAAVPLDLVSAKSVLAPTFIVENPSIRLADSRSGVLLHPSTVRRQLGDPCGALRRLLRAEGIRSVRITHSWPPY